MKLRSGRVADHTPCLRRSQLGGVSKQKNSRKEGKKILLSEPYLTEAIAYLPRDDIDSLPLVSRHFGRVVSRPAFQVDGPWRLLGRYWSRGTDSGTLIVRNADAARSPRFFAQFSPAGHARNKMGYVVAPVNMAWNPLRDIANIKVGYVVSAAEMAENLQRYPWLRAKETRLSINAINKEGIDAWSQLRQLWNGQTLRLYPFNVPDHLSSLAGGCKKLIIGTRTPLVNLSISEWINGGQRKGPTDHLELQNIAASIPLSDAVDFLFVDNTHGGDRLLKLSFYPPQTYPLGDLIEAIKERFLATPNHCPFKMEGRRCRADPNLGPQNYSIKHPTADGQCTVRIRWEKEGQADRGLSVEVKYPSA